MQEGVARFCKKTTDAPFRCRIADAADIQADKTAVEKCIQMSREIKLRVAVPRGIEPLFSG
jgi:hypothetical protein